MTLIESILQGKPLNFAIDRAAVEASVRTQNPGIVLNFLEEIAKNKYANTNSIPPTDIPALSRASRSTARDRQ